jgi:hypothetical protein
MLLVLNDAPEWRENEFCQWCSEQFMPAMRCVPGITEAWFYRAKVGGPAYLQVYYLSSLEVLLQPEYLRARGWGQSGNAAAQSMISKSPNLIVGVYEHISTAPSSASKRSSRTGTERNIFPISVVLPVSSALTVMGWWLMPRIIKAIR